MLKIPLPLPSWRAAPMLAVMLATSNAHAEIWAVTDSVHPLSSVPVDVRVIKLDDQQRIEEELSKKLPPNPHQAALAARQLMSTPAGAALMQQLAAAQQGNADAWSVGVAKVPAVVVDRRYVVYGQPDVRAAVQAINQARGR
ncbi:TIGR03757 family integrating conjugative element protein [Pseudomonas fluorescens]|uniref:TIGR03757 family integrating conjugative element protein n=1 Tax=Pseudomonas fluorescens TaxID=294 RepID=UPI001F24EA81|nr:TIGR03757 family integrating conjugative element protein [Pseudomonas fluorescens]